MAYGDRRGVKNPGEFKFADYLGFGLAGSLGIVAAMLVDLRQSAESSALFVINRWVADVGMLLGLGQLPLYAVVLIMMAIGAASVFYFQPVSLQGAFAQGFGVLAALMTVAPADIGAPLDAPMDQLPAPQAMAPATVHNATYVAANNTNLRQEASFLQERNSERYDVVIEINFPNGLSRDFDRMVRTGLLRGRLHNKDTGRTYNLFRNGGANMTHTNRKVTIRTSLPGDADTADLYARIEADKYAITVEQFTADAGDNPTWVINMTPSNTPLFIQRLGQSFWF